jgi:deoxyribose-phosphate aldolase
MSDLAVEARRAISLLDLTNLNDNCTAKDIEDLASRAMTPFGPVAALCIWPRFVSRGLELVRGTPVRIATVTNFPAGAANIKEAAAETAEAIALGAHEVDLVLPYRAILAGEARVASALIAEARKEVPHDRLFKVIIEAGELQSRGMILLASTIALNEGADFIKTSTGKVSINATLFSAEIMLGAIRRGGFKAGFKAAGGIRTAQDAASYLALADQIMGANWVSPRTFRFGASGVLADLIASAQGRRAASAEGY